jgi:single-strand DNA-binding protein
MASVNKVILVGRIGKDPDIVFTKSGDPILKFSVATSEKYKGEETTQWHNVVVFGKLAAAIKDFVTKGREIYVEGQMKYDKWEDKNGSKRTTANVEVGFSGTVVLLGKGSQVRGEVTTVETTSGPVEVSSDDVPF